MALLGNSESGARAQNSCAYSVLSHPLRVSLRKLVKWRRDIERQVCARYSTAFSTLRVAIASSLAFF